VGGGTDWGLEQVMSDGGSEPPVPGGGKILVSPRDSPSLPRATHRHRGTGGRGWTKAKQDLAGRLT